MVRNTGYHLNDNAFNILDENSSYWIGFLCADGYILDKPGKSPSVTLSLSEIDADHVYKFSKFLKSNYSVSRQQLYKWVSKNNKMICNKPQYRVSIYSDKIVSKLRSLGISGLESKPSVDLLKSRDFWRGMIDGDGSVTFDYRDGKPRVILVGSFHILDSFGEYVRSICSKFRGNPYKHSSIFKIEVRGVIAKKILLNLYDGSSSYLDRKHKKAMEILYG